MSTPDVILKIDQLPIQQNRVYRSQEDAINCAKGDILLVQDASTGVVYNSVFDPGLMIYDQNYQNEQGESAFFQDHLSAVADIVQHDLKAKRVVEVGCGKGTFLEFLRSRGCSVVGVDPAYEGDADYVIKTAFSQDIGLSGDVVVLRHVLEHVPDPFSFLDSIAEANNRTGLIYIEVPCLDWIAEHRAWFDIFYEHVNYFRIKNFDRFFDKITMSGKLFGGQYLYVVADLSSLHRKVEGVDEVFHFGDAFMQGVDQVSNILAASKDRQVVVWGGASKGVILAQQIYRRNNQSFSFSIDISPAKQGGYFPGTGLPVFSPEEGLKKMAKGDLILVMNSNYAHEIRRMAGDRFSYVIADAVSA